MSKPPFNVIAYIISGAFAFGSLCFSIGYQLANTDCQDQIQKLNHGFALDEVQGLRMDVNREVEHQKDLDDLRTKLIKCEAGLR